MLLNGFMPLADSGLRNLTSKSGLIFVRMFRYCYGNLAGKSVLILGVLIHRLTINADALMTPLKIPLTHFFRVLILLVTVVTVSGCGSETGLYQPPSLVNIQSSKQNGIYPKALSGLIEVKSFDVYVDQQLVHAVVAGVITKGSALSVRYLRSEDGGRHWSKPITLSDKFPAPIASRGNDIQIAAANEKLVALWQTRGEFPNQGPMVSVYSKDAGETWQMGDNPAANNTGDQAHIDLATDQNGDFHAVWLEDPQENGYQSVRYAKSTTGGQHWESGKTLDDSTCSCCWNTLIASGAGDLNLLYRDMQPRDMALLQSKDYGVTWQRISTVGDFKWQFDGCPHIGGGLAVAPGSPSNTLHGVVWTGVENKQGLYYLRSGNNGKTWSAPQRLGKNAMHGDIAAADAGYISAVWDEMGPEGSRVVISRSENGGRIWSSTTTLSQTGSLATHPRVVRTSAGILAVWTEKLPKQPAQWSMALFE